MLIIPPPVFRRRRAKSEDAASSPAVPVALTLLAAGYDPVGLIVLLTFDRPVDVSGFEGSQILVFDPQTNHEKYTGLDATVTGAQGTAVSIDLVAAGVIHGSGVLMNATGSTGIIAMNDGGLWAGLSEIELPFSE